MIEKIIYDYLTEELDVPVYMEMPEKLPKKFVLIEKTGSGLSDLHLYSAVIAVQSFDESLYKSANLNTIVINKMLNLNIIDKICKCDLNSDYYYPDLEKNLYRYQAVFDVAYLL